VPYISGEESKIETEVAKILGGVTSDITGFTVDDSMKVSASCNRVAVIDGHTESVFVEFKNKPAPSIKEIKQVLQSYKSEANILGVYSAPEQSIYLSENADRPQPRLDLTLGNGNAVVVGRVRECNVFDVKFTLLCHNTILGAAGSSIMNAEIALKRGLIN
jgi:aspartate-semialdehyde dehydrogenase